MQDELSYRRQLLFLLWGIPAVAQAQAPTFEPISAELKSYLLTVQDVRAHLPGPLALDPYVRARPVSEVLLRADSGRRLSAPALEQLLEAGDIRAICEPLTGTACAGSRGLVLRLTAVRFPSPDSAIVILPVSAARDAADHTVLVPSVRYFVYILTRNRRDWHIVQARRNLRDWRPM